MDTRDIMNRTYAPQMQGARTNENVTEKTRTDVTTKNGEAPSQTSPLHSVRSLTAAASPRRYRSASFIRFHVHHICPPSVLRMDREIVRNLPASFCAVSDAPVRHAHSARSSLPCTGFDHLSSCERNGRTMTSTVIVIASGMYISRMRNGALRKRCSGSSIQSVSCPRRRRWASRMTGRDHIVPHGMQSTGRHGVPTTGHGSAWPAAGERKTTERSDQENDGLRPSAATPGADRLRGKGPCGGRASMDSVRIGPWHRPGSASMP